MSIYDIRKDFSYRIDTSSIDYIRYYNFNTDTVTTIPITFYNSGSQQVPITVNIKTSEPWMQIIDPLTGADLKYPNGNIVLTPNNNQVVSLKVDLPPNIEQLTSASIDAFVNVEIKSGSFKIVPATTSTSDTASGYIQTSVDEINIVRGQSQIIDVTIYDSSKTIKDNPNVKYVSSETTIASVESAYPLIDAYTPIKVTGISVGETKITITSAELEKTIPVKVVPSTVIPSTGSIQPPPA